MWKTTWLVRIMALVAVLALPASALAQFGHPFNGTYSGGWGKNGENRLLLHTAWDGKQVTGAINPGPNEITIKSVTFDYSNPEAWGVKIVGEGKDASGKVVPVTLDGTLENVGVYMKLFHGTFTQGTEKGEFVLTRN